MELLVPTVSDIVFKYTWPIKKYMKVVSRKTSCDSPRFNININGIQSEWNLSIRFWKGPQGKRITNPVVLCLNMLNCSVEEVEQARVRFQFGVHNAEIKHWEFCHVNRTILELKTTSDILSLGYRDLCIVDRHVDKSGDITVMVKIQIIQSESEKHSLSQDMARLLRHPRAADTRLSCGGTNNTEIPVHSGIIAARSPILAAMIEPIGEVEDTGDASKRQDSSKKNVTEDSDGVTDGSDGKEERISPRQNGHQEVRYVFQMELCDVSEELTQELLRYIYSDHVDNLDALAAQLLSLAERFDLQGLKELCERNLIETVTPENVASLLLLADECSCEMLKRAALAYCEENAMNINKNLAWKMMEQANPELFNEGWTMRDCCRTIAEAWDGLTEVTIAKAWQRFLDDSFVPSNENPVEEVTCLLNDIQSGRKQYSDSDTEEWLRVDEFYPTWKVLSDEQIIAIASEKEFLEPCVGASNDCDENEEEFPVQNVPQPREVLAAMDTLFQWYEYRRETRDQDFESLRKMREVAVNEELVETEKSHIGSN